MKRPREAHAAHAAQGPYPAAEPRALAAPGVLGCEDAHGSQVFPDAPWHKRRRRGAQGPGLAAEPASGVAACIAMVLPREAQGVCPAAEPRDLAAPGLPGCIATGLSACGSSCGSDSGGMDLVVPPPLKDGLGGLAWRCYKHFQLSKDDESNVDFGVFGCEFRAWQDLDLYETLALPSMGASRQEIDLAYRRRALELSPDNWKGPSWVANEEFLVLTMAHSTLMSPTRRGAYDAVHRRRLGLGMDEEWWR